MASLSFETAGIRLSQRLHDELERIVGAEALGLAQQDLQSRRDDLLIDDPEDLDDPQYRLDDLAQAEELVAAGGNMRWSRYEVKDTSAISRHQRGEAHDGSLWQPRLDDAVEFDATLVAHSDSRADISVSVSVFLGHGRVTIAADDTRIEDLRTELTSMFESFVDPELLPAPPTFKVFIAHGGDPAWTVLHRVLNDIHDIRAEHFDSEERAGYTTLSVVEQMITTSTVALVVMTGEDTDQHGELRARENVVHELGFCQGALGIANTIVVLENGVSEPSNIRGLTQVRFDRGNILGAEDRIVRLLRQRQSLQDFQLS